MATLTRRTHLGADLQELEPDGAAGRGRELGVAQAGAAQRVEQDIGERREPQPELIGAHGRGGRPIGKEIERLLLDPVFHVAPSAVDVLLKGAGIDRVRRQ